MITSLIPRKQLNPRFWPQGVDDKLSSEVRKQLLKIATEFKKHLELDESKIEGKLKLTDVVFTGSLANFNWSDYSDIDLHLKFDFSKIDSAYHETVANYLIAKKGLWNESRDIKIYNYPLEVYAEDVLHPHTASGQYSLIKDEWIVKPSLDKQTIDKQEVKIKAKEFISRIKDVEKQSKTEVSDYESILKDIDQIKKDIKVYRQAGLTRDGEMATENLVFKVLRRLNYLDRLADLKVELLDKELSLNEEDNTMSDVHTGWGVIAKSDFIL